MNRLRKRPSPPASRVRPPARVAPALALLLLCLGSTACTEFEVASIVLDLRILGMKTSPPEVIIPVEAGFDLGDLPDVDVEVCALVADPGATRELAYRFTACWPTQYQRCDEPERENVVLTGTANGGFATLPDPEGGDEALEACATMSSREVLTLLVLDQAEAGGSLESVAADILANGNTLDVQLELAIRGADQDASALQYGSKLMRYGLPVPESRTANENPLLEQLTATLDADGEDGPGEEGEPFAMPEGRCGDVEPVVLAPRAVLTLEPQAVENARQDYTVVSFSGDVDEFTEYLVYTWYATYGSWEREQSGGPNDFVSDNEPPTDSAWTAPSAAVVGDGLEVDLWLVQRDERGGQDWLRTCVRVEP